MLRFVGALGELAGGLFRVVLEREERFQGAFGLFPQRPVRIDEWMLAEILGPRGRMPLDRAAIRLHLARQNPQERRLARPIRPNQSNPVPRADVERDSRKDLLIAVMLAYPQNR